MAVQKQMYYAGPHDWPSRRGAKIDSEKGVIKQEVKSELSRVDAAAATETDASVPSFRGRALLTLTQRHVFSSCSAYNSATYASSTTLIQVTVNRTPPSLRHSFHSLAGA